MREIKFRVFDKDYKKMHIVGKDGHDSLTCWDGKIQYYNLQNGEGSGEHGSYILMQYTGLTDKNGKEIYEGDYFQDDINIWEVGYQDSCFVAKCLNVGFGVECLDEFMDFETHQYCDVEVIGNIYENPHLLEESK